MVYFGNNDANPLLSNCKLFFLDMLVFTLTRIEPVHNRIFSAVLMLPKNIERRKSACSTW